jgi:hypothetical protein
MGDHLGPARSRPAEPAAELPAPRWGWTSTRPSARCARSAAPPRSGAGARRRRRAWGRPSRCRGRWSAWVCSPAPAPTAGDSSDAARRRAPHLKDLAQHAVQPLRRGEVAAKGLLDHHAPTVGRARRLRPADHGLEKVRWDRQVVRRPVRRAEFLAEPLEGGPVVVGTVDEPQQRCKVTKAAPSSIP